MCRAFIYSALQQDITPDVIFVKKPTKDYGVREHYLLNCAKLKTWVDYLMEQEEGTEIVFMDCDMLLLSSPFPAFKDIVDIGYTKRTRGGFINSGVVFAISTARTIDFFTEWLNISMEMLTDELLFKQWSTKYLGNNQSAFGLLLETGKIDVELKSLPCRIYNACGSDWRSPTPNGRVAVHYKSALRTAIITGEIVSKSNVRRQQRFLDLVTLWKDTMKKAEDVDLTKYKYPYEFSGYTELMQMEAELV